VVATGWIFFFMLDVFFALFNQDPRETAVMHMRFQQWPYTFLLALIFIFGYFIPVPIWMFRKFRRNIKLMFWTSIMVNIGMWSERYWLVVPGLERKYEWTFDWNSYRPGIVEITIILGTFALVPFLFMCFAKIFPPVSVWEEKEGQNFATEIKIGKASIPAIVREF
jgi:Ni/Fe-hydrogenase subunit HybB-like protein